ncbi:hypothetical protein U1Q18_020134 [Sarracenia purpurea var. burkii]
MACRILYVCFFLFGVAGSCAAVSWGLAPVGWMDQPGSCDMRGCFVCWMVVFLGMEWLMALGGLLLFFWHCSGSVPGLTSRGVKWYFGVGCSQSFELFPQN